MKERYVSLLLLMSGLVLITAFQNCSSEHLGIGASVLDDASRAETERAAKAFLSNKCAGCHAGASPTAEPNDILKIEQLIADRYIVAGKPQESPLYLDVIDGVMPPSGTVSEEEIKALRDYIINLAGGGGGGGSAQPATFTQVFAVIANRCQSCHMSAGNPMNSYADVTGFGRVVRGNAAGSKLYQDVATGRMPPGAPLSAADIEKFRSWIAAGAPNN